MVHHVLLRWELNTQNIVIKNNKEIEDVTKLINTPLKNIKKYENVPLGYIIKNDINYLNFMVKKRRITDINIIKLIDRKNKEIIAKILT